VKQHLATGFAFLRLPPSSLSLWLTLCPSRRSLPFFETANIVCINLLLVARDGNILFVDSFRFRRPTTAATAFNQAVAVLCSETCAPISQ
jgi:hypothetical protein